MTADTHALIAELKAVGRFFRPVGQMGLARKMDEAASALSVLLEERDQARYAPLGDNHHNAAACPHCGGLLGKEKAARVRAEEALRLCVEAFEKHGEWCGYNKDAPGNGIWYRAQHAADEALARLTEGARAPEAGSEVGA